MSKLIKYHCFSSLSLVELMIVVSIISILAAGATQQYNMYTLKTKCNLSVLPGDLDGDYMLDDSETGKVVPQMIAVLQAQSFDVLKNLPDAPVDDEIALRRFNWWNRWDGANFSNQPVSFDLMPGFFLFLEAGGTNNLCYQNGFKSHYTIDGSADRQSLPTYSE